MTRLARLAVVLALLVPACAAPRAALPPDAPAGDRLAFLSHRDGDFEIYTIGVDGAGPFNVTREPSLNYGVEWSPDGERLLVGSARTGDEELYVCDADGGSARNLTRHPARDYGGSWSPDGQRIVFYSERDHADGELYLMNADGSGVRRLTENERYEEMPAFSPDGRRIAFCAVVQGPGETKFEGDGELFIMDLASGRETRLALGENFDSGPAWSPDGTLLAFHASGDDGAEIYTVRPDGSGLAKLTDTPDVEEWQPSWSPDGRFLAICTNESGNYDIWILRADGSERWQVTRAEQRDERPRWRPRPR